MRSKEETLILKRKRAKSKRDKDPEVSRLKKVSRYHNESGYRERVMAKIAERRKADPLMYLYTKALRRAAKNGLKFNIQLKDLVLPEKCPVLGIPIGPLLGKTNGASIDRIDNSKGYVKGNVVIVSRRANTLKGNASIDELILMVKFYQTFKKP